MSKTTSKILRRNIIHQLPIFISTVFIVALSMAFFVAVKTVYKEYDKVGSKYFEDNALDDIAFYGVFTEDDIRDVLSIDGVYKADIKYKFEAKIKNHDTDLMLYSVYNKDEKESKGIVRDRVDISYTHEGKDSSNLDNDEIAINKNYAMAYDLKIGDKLTIEFFGAYYEFTVASFISLPNYIFLFKDRGITVSEANEFAVAEVNESFFKDKHIPYNAIYVVYDKNVDRDRVEKTIKENLGKKSYFYSTREQSANYTNYEQALIQIDTFAYICPIILLVMAALLLYVIQRRNVSVERVQIGIMKAMGLDDFSILFLYIKYCLIISILGSIVAFSIVNLVLPHIFNSLEVIFDLPNFSYTTVYWNLWIISFAIILFVSVLSNFMAAHSILKINPAQSMHGDVPKGGKKIFFEDYKFWQNISFNSRYTIKNIFRGKTRYFASVWGMFVAISITVFAQGFNDSFKFLVENIYNKFTLYDISVSVNPINWDDSAGFASDDFVLSSDKVAFYSGRIYGKDKKGKEKHLDNAILVYEKSFSSLNLGIDLYDVNGISLPKSLAKRINIKEGDYVDMEMYIKGEDKIVSVRVDSLIEQQGMFFIYMEKNYAKENFDINDTYNAVYVKTQSDDMKEIEDILDNDKDVLSYSFRSSEESAYRKQISTVSVLVNILVFVAFILGALSLYGIGVITLATRRYEFTLLKVMGYTTKDIMVSYFKETILQAMFAIPSGLLSGYLALQIIKNKFSSIFFDLEPHIYGNSYLLVFILLFSVVLFVSFVSARYISKLDMVEGLKQREE